MDKGGKKHAVTVVIHLVRTSGGGRRVAAVKFVEDSSLLG
jgi:hypothetical protein